MDKLWLVSPINLVSRASHLPFLQSKSGVIHTWYPGTSVWLPAQNRVVLRFEYPICDCVHSYSISHCQTPFFNDVLSSGLPQSLQKRCIQEPGAHSCARMQALDLVIGHWHSKNGCLKKGCVHISFQRPPCSDTKCERCIRYGKTGNKKRATCFETLQQNQLKSDVARFTTHVQTC